jgi:uncharacterized protein YndB with AHSA1/START domain
MTTEMLEAVRKTVAVRASQARAFEVFTARFGDWWPLASHHTGAEEAETVVIEPFEGGRWYERAASGAEEDWGRVLVWSPPSRLVLSWHLDADFQPDPDPAKASEVEIAFVSQGPKATLVVHEHRNLERFGARAAEVRSSIDGPGGWGGIIAELGTFIEAMPIEG